VWRGQVAAKLMAARRAAGAVADLVDLPLRRCALRPLLHRVWELRHVVAPYDANYIALAEALDVALLSADRRLAHAPGIRCGIKRFG